MHVCVGECGGEGGVSGCFLDLIYQVLKSRPKINLSNDTVPSYYLHRLIWRCWLALGTDCGYASVCHCSSTRSSLTWRRNCCPYADVSVWLSSPFAWCSRTNFLPLIDWLVDASRDCFFSQTDLCSVCFKDALWSVHPNGEVLHDARTLLQVLRHLRRLSRSVLWTWWDRHTHAKHPALALNPITPFNWIPPLYGRPHLIFTPLSPLPPLITADCSRFCLFYGIYANPC